MKQYLCIDLKSFYASVECVDRGLDPMTTNLVVADPERCETTICLAVSPSMKALGVKNRCRVFEIPKDISYIMAPPRMKRYIQYSADIYAIYLKYIAKEDIHVYSIDEAFFDVTDYLLLYHQTARELANQIREDILVNTGIPAACGIGTNLYLAKIALDITAKHSTDFMGYLDEELYREKLWEHRPLTDFWRVGPGIARRLERLGIYTMGRLAHAPEESIYRAFGVDAEILIDHAWGREPTTIADIKAYKPQKHSLGSAQVLSRDYTFEEGLLIVKEMTEQLCMELLEARLFAESFTLCVGYHKNTLPHTRGTARSDLPTNSLRKIRCLITELYKRIVNQKVPVRRISLSFNNVHEEMYTQLDFMGDSQEEKEQEKKLQLAISSIQNKYGKDAILKGMDLQEAATTKERNHQIGGHKSGE